jgi:hypothetical protein|tara:strand:+ start:95 stop:655 length:561 start_codon:yes stop_codon:yes gene_type:complete
MHRKIYRLFKIKDELLATEKVFLEHIQNKDKLNPPQQKIANNLYNKYFEGDWLNTYDKRKRRIAKSCAQYWINNPPKNSILAARILNEPNYIPTREEYKRICECKEARNFLNPEEAEPLYPAGSLVKIRGGGFDSMGKLGVVVKVQKDTRVFPSNPGKFLYSVLPQGMREAQPYSEKDLKLMETSE